MTEVEQAVEEKVRAAMQSSPAPLAVAKAGEPLAVEERERILRVSFAEIVKGVGIEHFRACPPELLEEFSVLALASNHNVKGILVSVIRSFMAAYATPETHESAYVWLCQLEALVQAARTSRFAAAGTTGTTATSVLH
ncbi:MAG: hypothetical protein GAK28_04329 [Luteibacter sp.]|uniref:hypothetical protein n=1 Tax=Luteibacter sp. TaxID=1886636 RepID=UPI00137EB06E|nr:hypothetical protein [Luteibacter sp.]KAF1003866.1 MAG: hypothetical protein GAK28_04329 [Luteibacter sp.]